MSVFENAALIARVISASLPRRYSYPNAAKMSLRRVTFRSCAASRSTPLQVASTTLSGIAAPMQTAATTVFASLDAAALRSVMFIVVFSLFVGCG